MKIKNKLVNSIIEGIQEKKGGHIKVVDLTKIDDTLCDYLVICDANSPTQVQAVADSIEGFTLKQLREKPLNVDGLRNAFWVAMDYSDVIVHIFLPDLRTFYDIDNLWEDAKTIEIPDLD